MGLLNDIYNKAKQSLTDDKGWFRQGKFTPVTQITGKSLQQQMNPPMLSPLASNAQNRPDVWDTPETYQNEQPAVIAPPKPSFKTQAAEKLNSRLDQIKRFGSSVVAKSMDNEGIVRQGQLRPFAPLDDAIKKPVVNFINKNTIFADPESNNGDNFWSSKRGTDLAEKRKLQELKGENAVLEAAVGASPIGMLDQTTKTQQAFSPYVNKFIDEQDQREKDIDTMVTNDIGKKLLKVGTRTGTNLLDQFNQSATNFSDSYRDLSYNTDGDRNVVKNIANILKSSAGAYAAGTGKTAIPSFLNATSETDFTKGITAGYTDIVTGTTQRGNNGGDSTSGKIGRFIGGIAGWKKNPINKAGSDIMDKFIPYENIIGKNGEVIVEAWKPIKNKILNFIATRGTRGMLEDVIDNLSKLEDDKTDAQNTVGFIRDELLGGLSEIVSEKVMDVGSKAIKSLWNGHPGQAITDMFRTKPDIKPEIETPKNSKFKGNQYVTIPVDTKIEEPKFVGNMDGEYESRWIGDKLVRFDKTTGKPVPKVGDGSQMMGGVAGMETYQDENGETKVRFNPEKAMAGIAIMGGVNSNAGKSVIKSMFKNTKVPDIKPQKVDVEIQSKIDSKLQELRENNTKLSFGTASEQKIAEAKYSKLQKELYELELLSGKKPITEEDFDWSKDAETNEGLEDRDYYPESQIESQIEPKIERGDLISEAKKYKSAEEFKRAIDTNIEKESISLNEKYLPKEVTRIKGNLSEGTARVELAKNYKNSGYEISFDKEATLDRINEKLDNLYGKDTLSNKKEFDYLTRLKEQINNNEIPDGEARYKIVDNKSTMTSRLNKEALLEIVNKNPELKQLYDNGQITLSSLGRLFLKNPLEVDEVGGTRLLHKDIWNKANPSQIETKIEKPKITKTQPKFDAEIQPKIDANLQNELDWAIKNNKKPETTKSIADIFANRKTEIGAPTQITVKGKSIDTDRLIKEGWETTQIDYAIKQANNAKGNIENIDGYVRGILKKQYPTQASKMGNTNKKVVETPETRIYEKSPDTMHNGENISQVLLKNQPESLLNKSEMESYLRAKSDPEYAKKLYDFEDPELKMERLAGASETQKNVRDVDKSITDMEYKFKQLEEAGYNPNPEIKVEPPKIETPKQPKSVTEILQPKSELERLTQAKKAELDYADIKRTEITDMMKKEGFDTSTATAEKIMSGEIKASPELKSAIEKHSKALGGEVVKYKGLPEDKLKENYVPHVKKDTVTPVDTESDGFVGMMNRNTFNPTKKRTGSLQTEDMADVSTAFRQEHISVLNSKYYDSEQANKIMAEHQLPPEKGDEVLNFVKQEREEADKIVTEHIEKTDFGTKHDYLGDAQKHEEKLAQITGQKIERPVVPVTHSNWIVNSVDNLQSVIRGDAMFFKDKTNKEINDAFLEFRLSQTGETKKQYGVELNKFISKLTKYDYADPAVKERVNMYIDDKLKENKVIQGLGDKILRGTTEVFSMAQIGGNLKTVIAQPTETLRIIPEHGIKSFLKGVTSAFNLKESKRLSIDYGLEKEISGNLAQNPIFKEVNDDPAFKDKVYDSFKNFLFKGLEVTENWKNVAYASALEDAGKKKGLSGEPLKKFVMQEMLRLAHMADTDMTPRIMKNNAVGGSLLQYSQYLLKNEVLKWDTITSKDLKTAEKIKKFTGLLLADLTAVGVISGVTGVAVDGAKGWFANSGLPSNLGPILTVPYQMGKEAWDFAQLTPEEQEKQTSLMDKEKAIILRNFIPMGNQISKTKGSLQVMDKGYAESKKGNVNYAVGDMNLKEKVQATLFGQGAIPAKKEADKRWDNLKKDGIYPTLTAEQSATLKDLPKDEQKAYYDSKMENQKSAKDIIKDEEKKPNLINSIFGKKETKEKQSISGILTSETATNQEKAKAKSIIKEKLDSGNTESINDDDLKTYFFNEVDKLPESTASEKQAKTIAKFKKLDSIYDSETLDQDTKDKLIELSGISKEDVTYYNNAKDDATVKAIRQEELAGTISKEEWMSQLEDGRKLVGNKQIVDNATLNELYERGLLSDAERDYLIAVKYDPAQGKFYVDRDYKDKQAKAGASATKKQKDALDKAKKSIYDDTDSSRKMTTKSIVSYLNDKPKQSASTIKTIGSILSSGKIKKGVTQVSKNSSNIKRVKSQYRFSK